MPLISLLTFLTYLITDVRLPSTLVANFSLKPG